MSSDDESRDNDKKTVASEEEKSEDDNKHDNFAVAMAPPAKKARMTRRVVFRKPRKVVESDDNFDAFLTRRRVFWATVQPFGHLTVRASKKGVWSKISLVKNTWSKFISK
jgi:hypothetical protein